MSVNNVLASFPSFSGCVSLRLVGCYWSRKRSFFGLPCGFNMSLSFSHGL